MNNYQQLQKNLRDLKLTQMSLQLDDYINKINDHKISVVDALYELTNKEVKVKNFNAANAYTIHPALPTSPHIQYCFFGTIKRTEKAIVPINAATVSNNIFIISSCAAKR